jgi:WD40 repeat protein
MTTLDIDHPWPGLASFRKQDARFFHGRDPEIGQLEQLVHRARCVVLYGASGIGKTSIINAGLVPRLAEDGYFAVLVRISYVADAPSVSEQLQAALIECGGAERMPKALSQRTAWEFLHLRDKPIEGAQPLLIFDQFEELFTIGAGTRQAAELIEELKGLIEGVPPLSVRERLAQSPEEARSLSFQRNDHRVLISIREDYLYGLESLRTQLPSLIHNRYRIGPLNGVMAMRVVLQQSRANGEEERAQVQPPVVDPAVAELIIRTVVSLVPDARPLEVLEVEPYMLSILCTELAQRRKAGTPITHDLVTGSRTDIISTFYERALNGVPDVVRSYIEDELVTATGYRGSAVLAEALAISGFTQAVLGALVDKRLLRVFDRTNGKWLELTHDILTDIASRCRKARQDRQREEQGQKQRLESEAAEELARNARAKRARTRVIFGIGALIVALVWLGREYAIKREAFDAELRRRQHAVEAEHAMRQQYIEASLRDERYHEALAHLATAIKKQPDATWSLALVSDLLSRRAWAVPASPLFPDGPFTHLTCDAKGSRCATAYRDGRVLVRGDVSRTFDTGQKGYADLWMSRDGKRLLFVPEQLGTALQWTLDATAPEPIRFPVEEDWNDWWASADAQTVVLPAKSQLIIRHLDNPATVDKPRIIERSLGKAPFHLSLDGRWLAYWDTDDTIALIEVNGERSLQVAVSGSVTQVRLSPRADVLLAAFSDGTVRRWSVPQSGDLKPLAPRKAPRRVEWIGFDSTGEQMILTLEGGGVQLWNDSWSEPKMLVQSGPAMQQVAFAPDGQWLVTAARDGTISAWSSSGTLLAEPIRLDGMAFAQPLENRRFVGVSLGGANARWSVPAKRSCATYTLGNSEDVRGAWFDAEDAFFAYGPSTQLTQSGADTTKLPLQRSSLFFTRDRTHSVTQYTDGLYLSRGAPAQRFLDTGDKLLVAGSTEFVSISRDGKRIAAVVDDHGYVFDVAAGRAIGEPIEGLLGMWLNDDGTFLATRRSDLGLALWSCLPDGSRRKLSDLDERVVRVVSHVGFSPANDALVVASENRVHVWSLRDQHFIGRVMTHAAPIRDAQFSPDGRWIVTASEDKRARIWDAATGLPASDWFEHDATVTTASFSPSGHKLLTATSEGQVRIWELVAGMEATRQEAGWLSRLAELLSGMQIDPNTNEALLAAPRADAAETLRREIEAACSAKLATTCDSSVTRLLRSVLGIDGTNRTARLDRP